MAVAYPELDRYRRRIVDDELDLLGQLPAVALEGPKGVGKTATAIERAATALRLDRAAERNLLASDPERLDRLPGPLLLDEWQRAPESWDLVRRSVDDHASPGRFLLTGSATPTERPTHSGAGRIVRLRMRPLSLAERDLPEPPSVSLRALLVGEGSMIGGESTVDVPRYVNEIVRSGFPGIRRLDDRLCRMQLDGYLARIVDTEFAELGQRVRRPSLVSAWLAAYGAATASTASYNAILDAATPSESNKPARSTTEVFRDVLTRLWILDPLPGWVPTGNPISRLTTGPKHHLADPALAARLGRVTAAALLNDGAATAFTQPDATFLGALFESLVALSVRVYVQACEAAVGHLRTKDGDHEVDVIVEGPDRRVVAIEVKLGAEVTDRDVRHLRWLANELGSRLADAIIVTTGRYAYRRPDGIAVVPAALLGP